VDWTNAKAAHTQSYAEKLARDYGYDHAQPLDRDATRALIGSDVFAGGMIDWGAGHIHPLRFALGLAQAAAQSGVIIYENSAAHHVEKGLVRTDKGSIRADHIVLACNGYLGHLEGKTAARVMPINNYIIATEPLGSRAAEVLTRDIAVADSKFVINYWRLSDDKRLIFGGGEIYGYKFPADIPALVRPHMLRIYPQLSDVKIDYAWGGTLGITRSRMPYFGQPKPGIWTAAGYSGHGVALATMAGKIIAQAIAGDTKTFDLMAKPRPTPFPGGGGLRTPLLFMAMSWYALRDRLGV
jgi:gamma-glutamylputrescine oxidase